jgi:hypothetical protein
MKCLKVRLRLLESWASPSVWVNSLEINNQPLRSDADDFDRAHDLLSACDKHGLLALSYYYAESSMARAQAQHFMAKADAFFYGDWRERLNPPDGKPKPDYWKHGFPWMGVFEKCLLWGSALSGWSELSKVGAFPEPDSYVDFSHKDHDRDLLLAIGAFCAGRPAPVVTELLDKSIGGRSQKCRLAAEALKAILAGDNAAVSKALVKYMKYHESKELPKVDMLCKISILGTFLYHAALRAGMDVGSVTPYLDYIVRLAPSTPATPPPR